MSVATPVKPAPVPSGPAPAAPPSKRIFLQVSAGLGLAAMVLLAEAMPLLRPGASVSFGIGFYQIAALGVAWLLVTRGLELRAAVAGVAGASTPMPVAARQTGLREQALILGVTLQLGLLALLFRGFALENPAFHDVLAPLLVLGFVLHELTPARHRPTFFLALSLAAITLVLGNADGLWLIGLGLGVFALCHLPVPFNARLAIVIAAAIGLAAMRTGIGAVPWSIAVWPIFGSIFMFRLAVYLYDLRHDRVAPGFAHRLGYFFMLPNVTFPLFPVVDYGAYRRTYYDADRTVIYQRGIDWIVRGTIQLLLYRVVYQELSLATELVATWDQLARHVLATFLLYIRVSGQFHIIVGILHLFGFHLPETHHGYYLSSSLTDFWRRINIYWKDFMMKVVYYPTFFRLRSHGTTPAMVAATLLVFFATWALHSYQWFWLIGSFPITWTDSLFWGILAIALVWNSLREARRGRTRVLTERTRSWRERAAHGARVAVTFAFICVLWSLWMSPSVGGWLALWGEAEGWSANRTERLLPLLILAGMGAYGVAAQLLARWRQDRPARAQLATVATLLLLYGASVMPLDALPASTRATAASVRTGQLNDEDVVRLTRGYYEDLMGVSRFNSQLWEVYMRRPPAADWPAVWETPAGRETGDFLQHELVAGAAIVYLGEPFTTNRWGMRDRDYPASPAPGTVRIALMGASIEMGWGVADGEPFEAVAEQRLMAEAATGAIAPVEILNFAVGAYKLPQQLVALDRVFALEPDIIVLAGHEIDGEGAVQHLINRAAAGIAIPPELEPLHRMALEEGLGVATDDVVRQRLMARSAEVESWLYREFVRRCRDRGIEPVWVFVPMADRPTDEAADLVKERARQAGFTTLDLRRAYEGTDIERLRLTAFDYHPNAEGHRALAEQLHRELRGLPALQQRPANGER